MTRSGLASGLSILLMATTIGTPAARECSIASIVCGMTPSSAATTSTTTSVALAPRARIKRKCFVTGRVEEDDAAFFGWIVVGGNLDAVRADVLRDPARLAAGDIRKANGIEQRSLSVVDVPHDGDHRSARHFDVVGIGGDKFFELLFRDHFFEGHKSNLVTETLAEVCGDFVV